MREEIGAVFDTDVGMRTFDNQVGPAFPSPGQVLKDQIGRDIPELAGAAVEDERNPQAVNLVLVDGAIKRSADEAETDNANPLHVQLRCLPRTEREPPTRILAVCSHATCRVWMVRCGFYPSYSS